MDQILNTILSNTYTVTALKSRLNVLKSYLSQHFFGAQQQQGETVNTVNMEHKDLAWLKSLSSEFFQNFNKDNMYNIFAELEKGINELKTLTIYLTFEPDDTSLANIGSFARKLFGNYLLLDTKFDPNLIAGPALVWKGIYKDYSLRSKIEQKKTEILDSFKQYLR